MLLPLASPLSIAPKFLLHISQFLNPIHIGPCLDIYAHHVHMPSIEV